MSNLSIVDAVRHDYVQDRAQLTAQRVAFGVIATRGKALEGEDAVAAELEPLRLALAVDVVGDRVPKRKLAEAMLAVPDVIADVLADPSNPTNGITDEQLVSGWARNWSDFAYAWHLVKGG